jgi:hypothetical protein
MFAHRFRSTYVWAVLLFLLAIGTASVWGYTGACFHKDETDCGSTYACQVPPDFDITIMPLDWCGYFSDSYMVPKCTTWFLDLYGRTACKEEWYDCEFSGSCWLPPAPFGGCVPDVGVLKRVKGQDYEFLSGVCP